MQYVVGRQLGLSLNENHDPIVVQEKMCPKLFFLPGTVADFMNNYFFKPDRVGSKYRVSLANLQDALRGRLVQFKVDGGKVTKGIYFVSSTTGANASDDEKHPIWRAKLNAALRYPDLPCINVGTKYRHALLPPEMAMLVPGHTFKRPYTRDLERDLARATLENATNMLKKARIGHLGIEFRVIAPTPQARKLSLAQLISESVQNKAQVLFIIAGVGNVLTALWEKFQDILRKSLGPANTARAEGVKHIVLSHIPGSDPANLWYNQLENAKKAAEKAAGDGAGNMPVAVVALDKNERNSFIYKTIKTLCDVDVGLQSFFMHIDMLEQKKAKVNETDRAAEIAANTVAKKVAVRNAGPPKPVEEKEALDISVAVHVDRFSVNAPKPKKDGSCTLGSEATKILYLVVLSSRDTESSGSYRTEVKLLGPKKIGTLGTIVKDFVAQLSKDINVNQDLQNRVVILRSGYVPECDFENDTARRHLPTGDVDPLDCPTDLNDKEVYSVGDDSNDRPRGSKHLFNKNRSINGEVALFRETVKALVGNNTLVSYVLTSENKDSAIVQEAKLAVEQHLAAIEGKDSSKASFFITDTELINPSGNTVSAHRKIHVKGPNTTLMTLTLLGDPLADDNDPSPKDCGAVQPKVDDYLPKRINPDPVPPRRPSGPPPGSYSD